MIHFALTVFALTSLIATCSQHVVASPLFAPSFHPVVVWHGLGDSAFSEPMRDFADELRKAFPGIYVRLVDLADDLSADQRAGFFGNVNEQVEHVCQALAADEQLREGFDAIGFSQGGQFMRAYVERCNKPAVRNLVTFGSQHMGISDLPACKPTELLCRLAEGALRGGIYTEYAQNNIVTAQYYRDPNSVERYEKYLSMNKFLTDINNEVVQNDAYKANMALLDNLVLLMFDHDVTVQPKQSSWFASYPIATGNASITAEESSLSGDLEVIPVRQSKIYLEDSIGLRALDKRGALVMDACRGRHMQIDAACSGKVFGRYIGIAPPSRLLPSALRHAYARAVFSLSGIRVGAIPTSVQVFTAMLIAYILIVCVALGKVIRKRVCRSAIRLE